jgi:uncharacterized iron-regulated protein
MLKTRLAIPALVLLALNAACASSNRADPAPATARGVALLESLPPSAYLALNSASGDRATLDAIADRCARADAVLIGEMHGHPVGLAFGAHLFDAILERNPDAVLSMEFFERDEQAAIDDYLAGITDEEGFRKATGRTDSNYPPGHRAMVERAKVGARPVVAANAPRHYARLARTSGFDRINEMTPAQRRLVEIPGVIEDSAYRTRFLDLMSGMGGHGAEMSDEEARSMADAFFRAQAVWDETMGDSVADATRLGTPVVHVVGRFHVERPSEGGGLTQEIRDRLGAGADLVVVLMDDASPGSPPEDWQSLADYVVLVGPMPE